MSRVHTKLEYKWDGTEYVLIHEEGFEYPDDAPVALCKGDDTARAAEAQQAAFNASLMNIFQQQFGKQTAIFEFIRSKMQPLMDNPTGYSEEALAAMRTGATDQLSQSYDNATKALQAKQFASGSRELPSGVNDQLNAALLQAEASDKASAQNNITLQNENQKITNYWNALNALNGQQSVLNPLGYAGAATAGSNAVANLSQAVTASSQSGLMGMLGGVAGGALQGSMGAGGGLTKLFCFVAAKIYGGWDAPETKLIQAYLRDDFGKRWYGKPVVWLYAKTGRWVAEQPILVKMLKPLFDLALRKATRG